MESGNTIQIYDWCSKILGSQISTYSAECQ
ncbi:hypothetical protein Gotur_027415 [Gossypium turneri]